MMISKIAALGLLAGLTATAVWAGGVVEVQVTAPVVAGGCRSCGPSAPGVNGPNAINPCAPVAGAPVSCVAVAPMVQPFSVPCFDLSGAIPPCVSGEVPDRLSKGGLRAHYRGLQDVVEQNATVAQRAMDYEAGKYARQTVMAGPVQDRFGDPMYTAAGPRAYAGTPWYVGPRYTASFERGYKVPATDKNPHYYERGADYTPQVRASSDAGLRSGASHSYLQSGMLYAPGMMAPSGSRPAALNH